MKKQQMWAGMLMESLHTNMPDQVISTVPLKFSTSWKYVGSLQLCRTSQLYLIHYGIELSSGSWCLICNLNRVFRWQETLLSNVRCVLLNLKSTQTWRGTCVCILVKNLINVSSVRSGVPWKETWNHTFVSSTAWKISSSVQSVNFSVETKQAFGTT